MIRTERRRALAFLLSEAEGARSRQTVTVASGEGVLEPGTVLGRVTASRKFVASPHASTVGREGAEVAAAVLAYRVDATAADATAVVIDTDAEVKAPELVYHSTVNDAARRATKADQLRALGIKVR
ncbi:head decoration protein [Pannonibacter tanglangensis]|uniref:Head decoration protein n=1 Tax=Pannonibacter tanglangensis TaxID=2750084 RepID=A0ABW9ZE77_9HYPH|nr:head decoration protein [Pannonibacter sp. XCT-34]NBN62791.1 head decoration protein [Pannonibacter sp. XCT-34]